jgi:hypothetical protein
MLRWLQRTATPLNEARNLFALVGRNGDTVDSIRELIAVPRWIEHALGLYAKRFPEDAPAIEKVLRFRTRVREEFDRLVRESVSPLPSDLAAQIERGEPGETTGAGVGAMPPPR